MIFPHFPISLIVILAILQPIPAQHQDVLRTGNYLVRLCGAGRPNSKASKVVNLLQQIWSNIQLVLEDAKLGTASQYGFATLFKDNDSIEQVQDIFWNIAAGSYLTPNPNSKMDPIHGILPTVVCIAEDDPTAAGTVCRSSQLVHAGTTDNHIALCPSFWDQEDLGPESDNCPRVRRNILTPNDNSLALHQQGQLLHELTHVYGVQDTKTDWTTGSFETYNLRDAADLDAADSLVNAASYVFYYSAVVAQCKKWPVPLYEWRGLLEQNLSTTDTSAAASSQPIIMPNPNATGPLDFVAQTDVPLPAELDPYQGFCNDAVNAPNASVCCDTDSGLWKPAPVIRDGAVASTANPACPTSSPGSGTINT